MSGRKSSTGSMKQTTLASFFKKPSTPKAPEEPEVRKGPGAEVVGRRLKVWWPADEAWYAGGVASYDGERHAIQYDDGERLYLDSVSGELNFAVDRERRWQRWIFNALHRGDFSSLIRSRPIWDLLMWPLMLGVTAGALSGSWIGIRRLIRSLRRPTRFPLNAVPSAPRRTLTSRRNS